MKVVHQAHHRLLAILVAGDITALVLWVVAGLASHDMNDNWLQNVVRISAPFLIGWLAAAPFARAYDLRLRRQPLAFMGRSALGWLLAISIGLFLRATLFGSGFVPIFAAVTVAVTGLFILGWRVAFVWLWRDAA
jgi:hypothetical protein